MPIAQEVAYFDHAAVAPLPGPTRNAIRAWLNEAAERGDTAWLGWARRIEEVRATAARLINAQPDFGWRVMMWLGALPALLVVFIIRGVEESPVWLERQRHLRDRKAGQIRRAPSG